MCFWFGLEILRLVYKKALTVSIFFDLLSSKKSITTPYKSWKNKFFKIVSRSFEFSKRDKIFSEKLIF